MICYFSYSYLLNLLGLIWPEFVFVFLWVGTSRILPKMCRMRQAGGSLGSLGSLDLGLPNPALVRRPIRQGILSQMRDLNCRPLGPLGPRSAKYLSLKDPCRSHALFRCAHVVSYDFTWCYTAKTVLIWAWLLNLSLPQMAPAGGRRNAQAHTPGPMGRKCLRDNRIIMNYQLMKLRLPIYKQIITDQ